MRPVVALSLAVLVVLAGCGDAAVPADTDSPTNSLTPSPTQSPSLTPSSSESEGDLEAASEPSPIALDDKTLGFTARPPSDTGHQPLELTVEANTTAARDADLGSPGDPVFIVSIDGTPVERTAAVDVSERVSVTITISREVLARYSGQTVVVNVSLVDDDLVGDDHIAGAERPIALPTIGTATPTAPDAPAPSATPHESTVTPTPYPPSTSRLSPAATPSPSWTPATSPTPSPTTSPSPTASPRDEQRSEWTVTVIEVVDGDTFRVRFDDGSTDTVRLLGVDTPETNTETSPEEWEGIPDTESGRQWLRDWGDKATDHAKAMVGGDEIRIETDEEADRRGSYGRLLVYAYHDEGQLFNKGLLTDGFARFYDSQFTKRDEFAGYEEEAQANDIGVWDYESRSTATPTPTPVPDGGGSGTLSVETIHYDADGDDHENLNDEYVVFKNTGDATLDLSGWTVTDEDDRHRYQFSGSSVAPGETVTLYTGSGRDSDTEVYWGERQAVWNNGGDVVHVTDDAGETVIRNRYEGNS